MEQNIQETLFFDNIGGKSISVDFDGGTVTSDAGALLLRATEKRVGIVERLARVIRDRRDEAYTDHELKDLLLQRIMQICCGYEDGNDCDALRSDAAIKCAVDKLPHSGADLASQPTMCRLENSVNRGDLYRMAAALLDSFIAGYGKKRPKRIILDLDDTDDIVHGGQQLSLFNAFVGEYCYQPLHIYEGQSGKLVTTILRPGKRMSGEEIVPILRRIVERLRVQWPKTRIIVRGDGHYSSPKMHEYCEAADVWYILGVQVTKAMRQKAPTIAAATGFAVEGKEQRLFSEVYHQNSSWKYPRRVIMRTLASAKGVDVRAIVTNVAWRDPRRLYERLYCERGQMENMIKDHKAALMSDRTSCTRFSANQFRLFLHSAAYVLMHALRERALHNTALARAQFDTIRLRLLKIGARVVEKSKRVLFHFPTSYSLQEVFALAHSRLQTESG